MHKNSRLITVVRHSGKRLYGGSAAQLKTDYEDKSLPSAKSWARPPQTRPSEVIRRKTDNEVNSSLPSTNGWARPPQTRLSAVSSGSHLPRDLGTWTTKKEPVNIEGSPRGLATREEVSKNVGISEETRPTLSSRSHSPRDLGKWTTKKELVDIEKTLSTTTRSTTPGSRLPPDLATKKETSKNVGYSRETPQWVTRPTLSSRSHSPRTIPSVDTRSTFGPHSRNVSVEENPSAATRPAVSSGTPSPRNLGKWSTKREVQRDFDVSKETPSPSRSQSQRDHGKRSTENKDPRSINLSRETPVAATRSTVFSGSQSRRDLENEIPRNVGVSRGTANASSSSGAENNLSSSRANLGPRPDYSSFQVFHDHDDPRRAPRRQRAVPERNTYHKNETVMNKPLIKKKSFKPRKQQIFRRKDVFIPTTLTVAMLARVLKVKLAHLLNKMRRVGMDVEASYDHILSADYAALLAEEFGFNPVIDDDAAFDIYPPKAHPNPSTLPSRPPIVTIMGHVDHGKTTLLDTLRSASVAKGEAGGITQHIGAFSVPVTSQPTTSTGPQSITFLDTPGHAAFSAMRARGANITDIVVLVVAADDGVMPQTEEVIKLLKREDNSVDLIVAINKIDKHGANPDGVKKALMAYGVQLEEFGGDIPAVHVSGLTGEGLPDLIETLSAVAEVRDLRADQGGPVYGHVIESNILKGLGSVATVLIRQGCLKIGSHIISGFAQGKVRRMTDSSGQAVQSAIPGMAVTVSGWKTLPKAGDEVLDGTEGNIKKAIVNRLRREETEALQGDAEAINESRRRERETRAEVEEEDAPAILVANDGPKVLKLLIKGDVSGSCEALEGALDSIGNNIAISKVIHTGVGDITESDILMAKAANGTIIGFSVTVPRSILSLAAQNEVPISTGNIIYRLIDDVRSRVIDMLPKIIETKVTGEATVLQLFDITGKSKQIIKVAGCRVVNGLVEKQKLARVIRNNGVIHEGSFDTMRQLKKEITEARKGTECGLTLKDFIDFQEGDLIQAYERIEKPGVI